MKEKKREKMMEEIEKKSKSKHSTGHWMGNKGFTIGPYTDAGALKEIQRFVAEKCTEDDNDEDDDDINNEGIDDINEEEMARQIQINQYLAKENNAQNQELDDNNINNNLKEENNINKIKSNLENDEEDDE